MTMSSNEPEFTEEDELPVQSELDSLRERADQLGIAYRHNTGVAKLRNQVNAKVSGGTDTEDEEGSEAVMPKTETANEKRKLLNKVARELIRVVITAKDPLKRELEGEYFTVANRFIGTIKRFIPFDNENGWHVERALLDMLKDKQVQLFKTVKLANGDKVRKGYNSRAYSVEVLPALTNVELKDLATQQAARQSITGD